jgi:hypothetical protein
MASPIVRSTPPSVVGNASDNFCARYRDGSGGDNGRGTRLLRPYIERRPPMRESRGDGPSGSCGIVVGPAARWPALLVGLQQKKPAKQSTVDVRASFPILWRFCIWPEQDSPCGG